jgi:hypothetical protein
VTDDPIRFCTEVSAIFSLIRTKFIRTEKYIERLTSKTRPKKILVCMIYYLDENPTPSWAGVALGALGYTSNPHRIQRLIQKIFMAATS